MQRFFLQSVTYYLRQPPVSLIITKDAVNLLLQHLAFTENLIQNVVD